MWGGSPRHYYIHDAAGDEGGGDSEPSVWVGPRRKDVPFLGPLACLGTICTELKDLIAVLKANIEEGGGDSGPSARAKPRE